MKFFNNPQKAVFLSRPNRFVVICDLDGREVRAFLPNPGRLWELLLPGVVVYLEEAFREGRKLPFTAVAVERDGHPVMLHTHTNNDVAHHLIERGLIPAIEGAAIVRREVTVGRSRLDFLLRQGGKELYLEVKSCTLFNKKVAMFPDAITERGRRHLEELATLSDGQTDSAVLFIIHSPSVEHFLPEYHTDLAFAKTLIKVRKRVQVIPVAVGWSSDLSLMAGVREIPMPWKLVEREAHDSGCYLLILRLRKEAVIEVGKLGKVRFREGYYTYVGSARKSLSKRVERHRRLRKRLFWHIDYLRSVAEFHTVLPIRTSDDLECEVAGAVKEVATGEVTGFGASDCSCPAHLFRSEEDPMTAPRFHSLILHYRMERLFDGR
ncbi:MAG: DNA/RNA nuclease SfsA [Thermodesulfobacteriota bacterium]